MKGVKGPTVRKRAMATGYYACRGGCGPKIRANLKKSGFAEIINDAVNSCKKGLN